MLCLVFYVTNEKKVIWLNKLQNDNYLEKYQGKKGVKRGEPQKWN